MGTHRFLYKAIRKTRDCFACGYLENFLREASYAHNSDICWGPPKVWEIETTTYCPDECIMCPKKYIFSRRREHMPLGLLRNIIEQIKPSYQVEQAGKTATIRLCHYAEPCLHPDFYETIAVCKQKGLYVVVSDTAALFTPEKIEDAIRAGLDELWMMLDGMDEETLAKIRGPAVSFQKSKNNIHALLNMKKAMGVSYPVIKVTMIRQPANAHQWKSFMDHWSSVEGANPFLAYFSNFAGDVTEINQLLADLQAINGQPDEDRNIRELNRFRCFCPWHSVSILTDGRVVPCCKDVNGVYILGDLNHESLTQIWNGQPIRELRREFISGHINNPLCVHCSEANNEIGLPCKYYPGFQIFNKFFPDRFMRRKK